MRRNRVQGKPTCAQVPRLRLLGRRVTRQRVLPRRTALLSRRRIRALRVESALDAARARGPAVALAPPLLASARPSATIHCPMNGPPTGRTPCSRGTAAPASASPLSAHRAGSPATRLGRPPATRRRSLPTRHRPQPTWPQARRRNLLQAKFSRFRGPPYQPETRNASFLLQQHTRRHRPILTYISLLMQDSM